jgi:hypothetical protein
MNLLSALMLAAALASPSPTATPSAQPSPARHKIFAPGPQFISVGAAISPRVQSEFAPASTVGLTSFEGWQTGETTLFGRFHVVSYTDYRSFSYEHLASEPVAVIGGGGFATVPSFRVHDDELESGGGVRVAPGVFAGMALYARRENSGYPPIHGIGYVLGLAPNPHARVTPYAWLSYWPNAGGLYALNNGTETALTYRGMRYRVGALFEEPGTRVFLDVGFAAENMYDRTNVPMRLTDSMMTVGLGFHF